MCAWVVRIAGAKIRQRPRMPSFGRRDKNVRGRSTHRPRRRHLRQPLRGDSHESSASDSGALGRP